jgi:hypothetical protein
MKYTPSWLATQINPIIGYGSINGVYDMNGNLSIWIEFAKSTTYGAGSWILTLPMDNFLQDAKGIVAFYDKYGELIKSDSAHIENNKIIIKYPYLPSLRTGNRMFIGFGDASYAL